MSRVSTHATILSKLQSVAGIREVYDHPANDIKGYPAIIFYPTECIPTILDTRRTKRTYTYVVTIMQEVAKVGVQKADRVLREIEDLVFNAFDTDIDLSGSILKVVPVESVWGKEDREDGQVRTINIKIQAEESINRS